MTLFSNITDAVGQEIIHSANKVELAANSTVFYQGASCHNYLLVLQGCVKVFTRAENGREIVLYRVNRGQSCTLTTTCLLSSEDYPAEGVTESDVTALAIPMQAFNRGLAQSASFRAMVFNNYAKRLSDVITLVGEVSFNRIDIRLAKQLILHAQHNDSLNMTHQALATELGTAREVISRQLKTFESQKLLTLSRGKITLINTPQLEKLANTALV